MSEYWIAHSSGPWKEHEYIRKVGTGSDAVYIYADGSTYSDKNGYQNSYGQKLNLSKRDDAIAARSRYQHDARSYRMLRDDPVTRAGEKKYGYTVGTMLKESLRKEAIRSGTEARKAKDAYEKTKQGQIEKKIGQTKRSVERHAKEAADVPKKAYSKAKKKIESILNRKRRKK